MPRIANNITALNAWRQLDKTDRAFASSMEKLSSGLRINRASDDPAGLVRSEQMRAQITGLGQGISNTQDAVSMIQTAEGALEEQHRLLNDMRALALHAMNTGVADSSSIAADQAQIDQAVSSLDSIAQNTKFAGKNLLNGSASNQGTVINSTAVASVVAGNTAPAGTTIVNTIITTAATKAAVTGDVNVSAANAAGTININGKDIVLGLNLGGVANIVGAINTALGSGSAYQAVASGNFVKIESKAYGSSQNVSVVDQTNVLFTTDFNAAAGTNTIGTINGEAATGNGLTLTANTGTAYAGTAVTFKDTTTAATYNSAFQVTKGQLTFQVGAEASDSVTASISDMSASKLGTTAGGATGLNSIKTGGTYALATNATQALAVIDEAITGVSNERAKLGSVQKYVLETKINSLNVAKENVTASESRIRDVDMALEMTNFTKNQILQQAATAMLAQANSAPQTVLQLLRG